MYIQLLVLRDVIQSMNFIFNICTRARVCICKTYVIENIYNSITNYILSKDIRE